MANGGNGQSHDTLATLVLSIFAFVSWFARLIVGRYFDRKDKIEEEKRERKREREFEKILDGIEHRHKDHK